MRSSVASMLAFRRFRQTSRAATVTAVGFIVCLVATLSALGTVAAPASATIFPCFSQLPGLAGIPPWGFHTSAPLAGDHGWYSRAYGNIDLAANDISGKLCQAHFSHGREAVVVLEAVSPLISHTHSGEMWGYPGNLISAHVKVTNSTDPSCAVGTVGVITMFGSYNGVRSDSIQYRFPSACKSEDHLYHGAQVNAQVPPA